ncbi:MAG: hypothetical protein KDJ45_14690 [Hyphomicrobiaceae bacterium]|nr:hypothetical protein [Hyphomicrobiaceae bacterium]
MSRAESRNPKHWQSQACHINCMRNGLTAQTSSIFAASVFCLLLSGCTNSGSLSTAALPKIPDLPKISLPEAPPPVVGTPTEVYERIGRGAMACWFGANGTLKSTHIYDAEAQPASQGGRAEINIRQRNDGPQGIRGVKAFVIVIAPSGDEQTSVTSSNLKLPKDEGDQMSQSVMAWAHGNQGCDPKAFTGAWQPAPAAQAGKSADKKEKAIRQ